MREETRQRLAGIAQLITESTDTLTALTEKAEVERRVLASLQRLRDQAILDCRNEATTREVAAVLGMTPDRVARVLAVELRRRGMGLNVRERKP